MPSPLVTITGILTDVSGTPLQGKVIFSLANQGSSIPRVAGTDILAQTTYEADANASGVWSATIFGNYQLTNTNTWYSVAIYKTSTQGGADSIDNYQFNVPGTFDLSNLSPISANPTVQPTQPLTAIVTNPTGVQTISTYALNVPGLMINGTAPVGSVLVGTGSQYTASFQGTKISVKDYPQSGVTPGQAKGVRLAASISSGAAILTLAAGTKYTFSAGDVGKKIKVVGAGAGGGDLYTTILTFTSTTQVTLNANASTSVSSATAVWWTIGQDTTDRTALEAASNAQDSLSALLICPSGFYLYDQTPSLNANFKGLIGDGIRETLWCASNANAGSFLLFTSPPRWEDIASFSIYGPGYGDPAQITAYSVATNVATFTVGNSVTLPVGSTVRLIGFVANGTIADRKLFNYQTVVVATSSSSQFTANLTHGDVGTTSDNALAFVDEAAIWMGPGLWFGSIENIEIYGFRGNGIKSETPILDTWHRIWIHATGGPQYLIFVKPPTPVGGTVHGMYNCFALGGYCPGFWGYYMQSTCIANCGFEGGGGGMVFDSCEGITIVSPHLEQFNFRNASVPGHAIWFRGGRAITVTSPFHILDSAGNVSSSSIVMDSSGTNINFCQQIEVHAPFYFYQGSGTFPTFLYNFADSGVKYCKVDNPNISGTGSSLTFQDLGANNSLIYQGIEQTQGVLVNRLTGSSGNAYLETRISGDTGPRIRLSNDGLKWGDGAGAIDWRLFRSSSGMTLNGPSGTAQFFGFDYVADTNSRIGWNLNSSGLPGLFMGTGSSPADMWLSRSAAGTVKVGSTFNSQDGTVLLATVTAGTSVGTVGLTATGTSAISSQGTVRITASPAVTASNWAASASWGASPTGPTVQASSFNAAGRINIIPGGAGIVANPTLTFTYAADTNANTPIIQLQNENSNTSDTGIWVVTSISTTTAVATYVGTPVSGRVYGFSWWMSFRG